MTTGPLKDELTDPIPSLVNGSARNRTLISLLSLISFGDAGMMPGMARGALSLARQALCRGRQRQDENRGQNPKPIYASGWSNSGYDPSSDACATTPLVVPAFRG